MANLSLSLLRSRDVHPKLRLGKDAVVEHLPGLVGIANGEVESPNQLSDDTQLLSALPFSCRRKFVKNIPLRESCSIQ
jgi:hypothetical protein